jgi:ribosome-associated toxin RatA of RatAB toxin-antitoxin module
MRDGRGTLSWAPMSVREPVLRRHFIQNAKPAEVYAVVTDFLAYPRLFPEFVSTRVVRTDGNVARVEFKVQIVMPVRYVLDLRCEPETLTVDWTYVEGEIVTNSTGGWRFAVEGEGTHVEYRAMIDVKAPVPGFILRKVTDGLVAASIPNMFRAIEGEIRSRQARQT